MGKYSPSHVRPRPLLVKLLRTTEVSVILSNRSKLTKSKVYIKPYMTPSERNSESILLKERKSLISSGANPKDIKVKSNKLLLNGSVYGSVQGSSFSLNVQNSIQVSSDSHVDVDPVDSTPPNAPKPPFENEPSSSSSSSIQSNSPDGYNSTLLDHPTVSSNMSCNK